MCFNNVSAKRHKHRAARAIVAAKRGGAVGDNPVAFALRLRAGTKRYRIEMRGEQKPRARPGTGKIHDQVAGLRRQRNALVRVVETYGRRGNADFLQFVGDSGGDRRLLAGDPFHRKKFHQMVFGGLHVDGRCGGAHVGAPFPLLPLLFKPCSRLQSPGETQEIPGGEKQRPDHQKPGDVGQHQRDDGSDPCVFVVFLGKPDDQCEVGVERRDGIDRGIADPVGCQDGFRGDTKLHQERHKDRREDGPFGDRPRDKQIHDGDDDDKSDQQPKWADVRNP